MAARKVTAYRVKGAAAVIRKDKHERYLDRGAVFSVDSLDADNAKHLLGAGLIEAVIETDAEVKANADAEAKAAADAKAKADAEAKAVADAAAAKTAAK